VNLPEIELSTAIKNAPSPCSNLISFLVGRQDRYILSANALYDRNLSPLAELGYRHLYGIGPNTAIYDMPYYTKIKYLVADPTNTHFPESFFDCVYVSHPSAGPTEAFLRESARILDDEGILIITTQTNSRIAGSDFLALARKFGFKETHHQLAGSEPCLLQAMMRSNSRKKRKVDSVNLVCPTLGRHEGIAEYTLHLKKRFEEAGIQANVFTTWKTNHNHYPTIIEYEPRLQQEIPEESFIIEAHRLPSRYSISVELRNSLNRVLANPNELFQFLRLITLDVFHLIRVIGQIGSKRGLGIFEENVLLVRSNELAEFSGVARYVLMPHIAYASSELPPPQNGQIRLGSFGFATKGKNFDKICDLAKKLGLQLTLMLSINEFNERTERETQTLAQQLRCRYESEQVHVHVGFFSDEEIRKELGKCTHLISAQDDSLGTSGSLRYMISIGRPVISLDSMQAREAQVYRVKSLDMLTLKYLRLTTEPINLDDGFRYLVKFLESLPEEIEFLHQSQKKKVYSS
jgi:SAM-dependent methyltransferase